MIDLKAPIEFELTEDACRQVLDMMDHPGFQVLLKIWEQDLCESIDQGMSPANDPVHRAESRGLFACRTKDLSLKETILHALSEIKNAVSP